MLMIAVIAGILGASAEAPKAATTKVKVDGSSYRVRVRGDEVEVASKSLFAIKSLDSRERMRRAVAEVTGCRMVDELRISTTILQGRLACGPQ